MREVLQIGSVAIDVRILCTFAKRSLVSPSDAIGRSSTRALWVSVSSMVQSRRHSSARDKSPATPGRNIAVRTPGNSVGRARVRSLREDGSLAKNRSRASGASHGVYSRADHPARVRTERQAPTRAQSRQCSRSSESAALNSNLVDDGSLKIVASLSRTMRTLSYRRPQK
jgi:hypothetical protein